MSSAPTLMHQRPGILKTPSVLLGTDFTANGVSTGGVGGGQGGGTVPDVASSGGSSLASASTMASGMVALILEFSKGGYKKK